MAEKRLLARLAHRLLTTALVLSIAACSTPKGRVKPPVELPKRFSRSGPAAQPSKWWTAFRDPSLNVLVEEALKGSFSLRAAWDRLDQARATAVKQGAALWPSVNAEAGVSNTVTHTSAESSKETTAYSLGLAASYEVDLWGRVRSTRDAARLSAMATEQDLHAAAMTLTAEIVKTWYEGVEQRAQLQVLNEQIAVNEKFLEVITLKFRRGQVSATDVLQQRQVVENKRGDRVLAESSLKTLEHKLATLVGRSPGQYKVSAESGLPKLPARPRTGLPAAKLRRRPDVRSAELAIESADRSVAAAIADRFPALSLTARASTSSDQVRNLFDNWLAGLAANVAAPLLDGGRRRAEVERTRAVLSEKLNTYGQTLLDAFREVEDALVQESKQAEYLASLDKQLGLSAQASEQTRDKYVKGSGDFTRYLDALLSHQDLQRTRLRARLQLVEYRIALYRALGGAWALPRPERAKPAWEEEPTKRAEDGRAGKAAAGTRRS